MEGRKKERQKYLERMRKEKKKSRFLTELKTDLLQKKR